MESFVYEKYFQFKGKKYCIIGEDISRNEIECQTVPSDNNFYWFKVIEKNKILLIN